MGKDNTIVSTCILSTPNKSFWKGQIRLPSFAFLRTSPAETLNPSLQEFLLSDFIVAAMASVLKFGLGFLEKNSLLGRWPKAAFFCFFSWHGQKWLANLLQIAPAFPKGTPSSMNLLVCFHILQHKDTETKASRKQGTSNRMECQFPH